MPLLGAQLNITAGDKEGFFSLGYMQNFDTSPTRQSGRVVSIHNGDRFDLRQILLMWQNLRPTMSEKVKSIQKHS